MKSKSFKITRNVEFGSLIKETYVCPVKTAGFGFQARLKGGSWVTTFNRARKPNPAVLTGQTYVFFISDPNPTFWVILKLFYLNSPRVVWGGTTRGVPLNPNPAVLIRQTLIFVHCRP